MAKYTLDENGCLDCLPLVGSQRDICRGYDGLGRPVLSHRIRKTWLKHWGLTEEQAEQHLLRHPTQKVADKKLTHGDCLSVGMFWQPPHPKEARPEDGVTLSSLNGWGPGSQLFKYYTSLKIPHCAACYALAARMDHWGPEGCEERLEMIVLEMVPRAKLWVAREYPWLSKLPGAQLISLKVIQNRLREDISRAIAAAKAARPAKVVLVGAPLREAESEKTEPTSAFIHPLYRRQKEAEIGYPLAPHKIFSKVAAVCCHFNPCGYAKLEENYYRFRDALPPDLPLWTAELAFDDKPFRLDAGERSLRFRGNASNILWQKERMLNLTLAAVPPEYDCLMWLDADLLWVNENWLPEALLALQTANAVQLFSHVVDTDITGAVVARKAGHIWARLTGQGYGRPGGAWLARREILSVPLYDHCVLGGGDSAVVYGWEDRATESVSLLTECGRTGNYFRWVKEAHAVVGSALSHVRGDVLHLYHGSRDNRQYQTRYRLLLNYGFNHETDLETDPESGLLRWTESAQREKPGLVHSVREYFFERKEDD